jgi:hypothetical protein
MRASLEVADIFRSAGPGYRAAHTGHLSLAQCKVMSAIESCRTANREYRAVTRHKLAPPRARALALRADALARVPNCRRQTDDLAWAFALPEKLARSPIKPARDSPVPPPHRQITSAPDPAKDRNPHRPPAAAHGFLPSRLSDALRRPKHFTFPDSPLSGARVPSLP